MNLFIPLTQGLSTSVPDSKFDLLNAHKWYAVKARRSYYAVRHVRGDDGKQRRVYMHWEIMGCKGIDHIDGDGLNNLLSNLRVATPSQNGMNQRKQLGTSSRFKGVYWYKRDSKWYAYIWINGKRKHLGCFEHEIAAALAYDQAAMNHFGEFAKLNFLTASNER